MLFIDYPQRPRLWAVASARRSIMRRRVAIALYCWVTSQQPKGRTFATDRRELT